MTGDGKRDSRPPWQTARNCTNDQVAKRLVECPALPGLDPANFRMSKSSRKAIEKESGSEQKRPSMVFNKEGPTILGMKFLTALRIRSVLAVNGL